MSLCSFIKQNYLPKDKKAEVKKKKKKQSNKTEGETAKFKGITLGSVRKGKYNADEEKSKGLNLEYFNYPRFQEHVALVSLFKKKEHETPMTNAEQVAVAENIDPKFQPFLFGFFQKNRLFRFHGEELHLVVQSLFSLEADTRELASEVFVKVIIEDIIYDISL